MHGPTKIVQIAYRDWLDPYDKRVRIDTLKWLCEGWYEALRREAFSGWREAENPIEVLHDRFRSTG